MAIQLKGKKTQPNASCEFERGRREALEEVLKEMYVAHELSDVIHTVREKLEKKENED